jgi:hypothetical protein
MPDNGASGLQRCKLSPCALTHKVRHARLDWRKSPIYGRFAPGLGEILALRPGPQGSAPPRSPWHRPPRSERASFRARLGFESPASSAAQLASELGELPLRDLGRAAARRAAARRAARRAARPTLPPHVLPEPPPRASPPERPKPPARGASAELTGGKSCAGGARRSLRPRRERRRGGKGPCRVRCGPSWWSCPHRCVV